MAIATAVPAGPSPTHTLPVPVPLQKPARIVSQYGDDAALEPYAVNWDVYVSPGNVTLMTFGAATSVPPWYVTPGNGNVSTVPPPPAPLELELLELAPLVLLELAPLVLLVLLVLVPLVLAPLVPAPLVVLVLLLPPPAPAAALRELDEPAGGPPDAETRDDDRGKKR